MGNRGGCHGPGYCGADGLYGWRGSPADEAKRVKDAAQARRLLAIAAVLDGASRTEAANIGGMDRQTLRDWVIRFNDQGPDGLINIPSPGVPPKLDATHRALLARIVEEGDRKSTRLNSSHQIISYAVFCLKKKKNQFNIVLSTSRSNLEATD